MDHDPGCSPGDASTSEVEAEVDVISLDPT